MLMKLIEINLLQGLTDSPLARRIDWHQCTCNAPRLENALDSNTVSNTREFASITRRLPIRKVVPILVQRGDSALFLGLKIPK